MSTPDLSALAPLADLAATLGGLVAKAIADRHADHAKIAADTDAAISRWRSSLSSLDQAIADERAQTDAALASGTDAAPEGE